MLKIILRKDTDNGKEEELPIYSSEVSIPTDRFQVEDYGQKEYEDMYWDTGYGTSISEALTNSLVGITCFNTPCVVIYEPEFDYFNSKDKEEVKETLKQYFGE